MLQKVVSVDVAMTIMQMKKMVDAEVNLFFHGGSLRKQMGA